MAGDDKTKSAADSGAKPKAGKKKLIIIVIATLLIAGGAGGWFYLKSANHDEHAEEEAPATKKARVFLPIDPFTVNLSGENNRFAQVAVTFELSSSDTADNIKNIMPAVRDRVLRLISAKRPAELLSSDGKEELAHQIATETAALLGWEPEEAPVLKTKSAAASAAHAKPEADSDEDDAGEPPAKKSKAKAKPKKPKASKPNPISGVHFAQFIIQ